MFKMYARGRWAAFLSPSVSPHVSLAPADGDDEHILSIYYDGTHTLPNPQQMIGWAPAHMWNIVEEYINERHADDEAVK